MGRRLAAAEHTRPQKIDLEKLKPGVQVDLWRQPERKDIPGWRGPAILISVDNGINAGTIKWQGRHMSIPLRHIRLHIGFVLAYLVLFQAHYHSSLCDSMTLFSEEAKDAINVKIQYDNGHDTLRIQPNQTFIDWAVLDIPLQAGHNITKEDLKRALVELRHLQDLVDGAEVNRLATHGRIWSTPHSDYVYLPTAAIAKQDDAELSLARKIATSISKRPSIDGLRFGTGLTHYPALVGAKSAMPLCGQG